MGAPQPQQTSDDPVSPEAAASGDIAPADISEHAGDEPGTAPDSSDIAAPTAPSAPAEASTDDSTPLLARPGSKKALVIELLSRADGATLEDMTGATEWLPHTVRATLSGLRKAGHAITSDKAGGVRSWRIIS